MEVFSGALDSKGNMEIVPEEELRIARPTAHEVAKYGVTRRDFMKYAGKTAGTISLLGVIEGCGGNGNSPKPGPSPTKVTATGSVYDTITNQPLSSYRILFGSIGQEVSGNGNFSIELDPGTYTVRIEPMGEDFLGPSQVSKSIMSSGTYDFDVICANDNFKQFVNDTVFNKKYALRRWIVQPRFVIDASFPQQYIDQIIKDVIHNDVPLCNGRLFSLKGDDSVIEVSGSMPDKTGRLPKGAVYIYNGSRFVHGHDPGTPNALDNGFAEFDTSANRAVASQEILQNLGPGSDSEVVVTIFYPNVAVRGISRPSQDDQKLLNFIYSREPGTIWPDIRP